MLQAGRLGKVSTEERKPSKVKPPARTRPVGAWEPGREGSCRVIYWNWGLGVDWRGFMLQEDFSNE